MKQQSIQDRLEHIKQAKESLRIAECKLNDALRCDNDKRRPSSVTAQSLIEETIVCLNMALS